MMKTKIYFKIMLGLFVLFCSFFVDAATPFFTISPLAAGTQTSPQFIAPKQTIAATYTITNTSGIRLSGIHLDQKSLPVGGVVTQDIMSELYPDQCDATFTLDNNQSCTLRLLITGAVDQSTQVYGTPTICSENDYICSQSTRADRLYVSAVNADTWIEINSVQVGKMDGDTGLSDFSMEIDFTNGAKTLSNWQFGFYMPRTFAVLQTEQQTINPRLEMRICQAKDSNDCAMLTLQQSTRIIDPDKSIGYTTILAPSTPFSLMPNTRYIITFLHNNQYDVGNYSSLPQNFFVIESGVVSQIKTNKNTYTLLDYDPSTVAENIATQMQSHWTNSNTVKSAINIVPAPQSYTSGTGSYSLQTGVVIHNALNTDDTVANFFVSDLENDLQDSATIDHDATATSGIIIKQLTSPTIIKDNPEGYQLVITPTAITINALNNTGVFYALQTLRQLWIQNITIPAGTITDYPRFKYRGVLLDTARHYFSVGDIENLIDLAAAHKLNTLHIHFADDEGCRLGLNDYYERLAKKADTRGYGNNTIALMFTQGNLDITNTDDEPYALIDTKYSGTYSEADLQSLIQYANARSITIIPEIDFPGHARALIKAFPEALVDLNDSSTFMSVQGYNDDVLPVCTYGTTVSVGAAFTSLINNLVAKTAALFNGQSTLYAENEVSVGGDEVSPGAWTNDTSCTDNWQALNALQKSHKFFSLLAAQHSTIKFSGWQQYIQNDDESLGDDIVPATQAGHVWVWSKTTDGIEQAKALAEANYPVVLAFADKNYFDLTYTPDVTEPGFSWAGSYLDTYSALSSAVSANQVLDNLSPNLQANILGVEGTLWTENISTYRHLVYKALPKMAGLAEAGWSDAALTTGDNLPDWQDLAFRLGNGANGFLYYLNSLYGVAYRGYPYGICSEAPASELCRRK